MPEAAVVVGPDGSVIVLQPMGARAAELIRRLKEKGVTGEERPVWCG